MMSTSASIQKVSHKHEAILNFLLDNPTLRIGEVAAHFNVTFPWMSTIIHSHAFQNQLKRRQDQIFDCAILGTVEEKLGAAAQVTMDAYLEKVPTFTADQLISAQDKLLGRLGYGSNGHGPSIGTQINVQVNHVSKEILEEARNRIGANKVGASNSIPAIQDQRTNGAAEIEGVVIRGESESQAAE